MFDKYILCVIFGFMVDKMSIFPFVFGFIVGTSLLSTTTIPFDSIQYRVIKFVQHIKEGRKIEE